MIKSEETKTGLRTEMAGRPAQLLTELTAIIEGLYQRDVLNEDLLKTCWQMATIKEEDRVDFMKNKLKEEIEKTIKNQSDDDENDGNEKEMEEKIDELMKEIMDFIKNQ